MSLKNNASLICSAFSNWFKLLYLRRKCNNCERLQKSSFSLYLNIPPRCIIQNKCNNMMAKLLSSIFKVSHLAMMGIILQIIPLPVPNWASAEEQFIPNYPPQITIYSKFFFENPNFSLSTKFFCHCHCRGIKRKVGAGEIGI